jgi:hypothetical protein
MLKQRASDEPWNEQTFFAHAEGLSPLDTMGLRRLFAEVILRAGALSIVWGKGDIYARFIVRVGENSADFVSGWATGRIDIQVASLRAILGERQNVLDELATALDVDWRAAKEPRFDATRLESEDVATAMSNLLAAMAGVDGAAAVGGYKIAPR